jgi:hypothetical protein
MSSILVRFPDGTKEFRYQEVMLEAGTVVWHEGASYRVVSVEDGEQAIAVVESASPSVEAHVLAGVTTGTPMVMSEQLESTESLRTTTKTTTSSRRR